MQKKQYDIDRLDGDELNRAVQLAEGRGFPNKYAQDVSIANTVIVRERITTGPLTSGFWYALYEDEMRHHHFRGVGPTPQIAALRSRVRKFVNGADYIAM